MTKLPKEKRDRLILVIMGTAGLLFLISFGLIRNQYDTLDEVRSQTTNVRNRLLAIQNDVKKGPRDDDAQKLSAALARAEADVASGDAFQWTYDTIRNFKTLYKDKVDIPTIGQPVSSDADLLPKFPYRQVRVSVAGTAYYHELGKFIADFENRFPHIRITNLTLDTAGASAPTVGGAPASSISEDPNCSKIAFRMDIIALIKPAGPQS